LLNKIEIGASPCLLSHSCSETGILYGKKQTIGDAHLNPSSYDSASIFFFYKKEQTKYVLTPSNIVMINYMFGGLCKNNKIWCCLEHLDLLFATT
jgi:hypothetical protein